MNRKVYFVSAIVLTLVFCCLFWVILRNHEDENRDNPHTDVLTQISIPREEDEFFFFEDLHISENEEEIFLVGQSFVTEQSGETVDSELSEGGNNVSGEVQMICEEVLYRATKEKGTVIEAEKIDTKDYLVDCFLWDGDKLYFIGNHKENAVKNEDMIPVSDLYYAEIEENSIKNVRQIDVEDNIKPMGSVKATINNGTILFYGVCGDTISYYTGEIENEMLKKVEELDNLSSEEDVVTALRFADGSKQLFMEKIYLEEETSESEIGYGQGYEIADLSKNGISNCRKVEFDNNILENENAICFDINEKNNAYYYAVMDMNDEGMKSDENTGNENSNNENGALVITIYKTQYGKTINNILKEVTDTDSPVLEEKKEYHNGDYSYDEYDVGHFETVTRNKSDMSGKQGIYYEIFVRSFADSDGDGIGDFNGIRQKLDYLAELGIEGIWLMPINASSSYHGYDITDYMALNPDYGTEEDLSNLISEAHAKGIKVIMDFPINHTSSEHPWFAAASSDENSEYRNYYRWVNENDSVDFSKNDESDWGSVVWHRVGDSYYYGMFGEDMPDLNYNNPKVREEIKSAAGKWLEMGIDGFRLDAAMHIYGNNEFKQEENPTESTLQWWNEFAVYCENINPNVYLVGEAWRNEEVLEEYVQPFDTKFNFAFEEKLMEAVINETAVTPDTETQKSTSDTATETSQKENISQVLQNILDKYASVDSDYLDGIFGTNHDQNRIMSQVEEESKARLVANIYLTLPGNPYIYYGEELGMLGSKPDEMIRTPFKWSEGGAGESFNTTWISDNQNTETPSLDEQINDETSMYHFYKNLIAVRKSNRALLDGKYTAVDLKNNVLMGYKRESGEQKLLVIHNLSDDEQTIDLAEYSVKGVVYYSCPTGISGSGQDNIEEEIKGGKISLSGETSVILELES